MSNTYDALVIGGGHNGLVSAAYLARSGARTLVLEGRGVARRCGHHRVAMGGRTAPAGDAAVLRDEPDAADDRAGTGARAARLQGSSDGPVLPGVSRGRIADDLRGRPRAHLRAAGQVVQEGCRGVAEVERLARGHRRRDGSAAHPGAAEHRLAPARRSARPGQAGVEPARDHRAHHRRRHPAAHDEHRRPARRLVRITPNQRCARRQRRDRHLGRAVRAGHRLRDGAPLDRRRRRRPARQLGIPRRRHGRGLRSDRPLGPRASVPRSAPTRASRGSLVRGGRVHGAVLDNGDEIRRAAGRYHPASENRFPRPYSARRAARRLRHRHRALEDPQRRGEDQSGAGRAAQLHRGPQRRSGRASHRFGRDGADDGIHRGGVPGCPRGSSPR